MRRIAAGGNDKIRLFSATVASTRIFVLVYPGFQLLDLSGPAGVFTSANEQRPGPVYTVVPLARGGGLVTSSTGIRIETRDAHSVRIRAADSLFVTGGDADALQRALADASLSSWLSGAARRAGRYGSICAGAFLLAAAGLLAGKRATTHWAATDQLAALHPEVTVEPDALYVHDGSVWTSAGASTGIDMALAIVEHDLGTAAMGKIAKQLVVYARRPGNQSQFSTLLDTQLAAGDPLADVIAWIDAHLEQPLRVARLAEQVGMTERTFYRRFTASVGTTPSKYVEGVRLERARQLLECRTPIKAIAAEVGFKSEAGFRTAFENRFGISSSLHRRMHAR